MSRLKRTLKDPRTVVVEALDGMAPASAGRLVRPSGLNAILRGDISASKVLRR